MYRSRAIAGRGRLRHWAGLIGVLRAVGGVLSIDAIRVQGCECKDFGEDRQMHMVLLHRGCLAAMAQACVGVMGVSATGVLWCVQML